MKLFASTQIPLVITLLALIIIITEPCFSKPHFSHRMSASRECKIALHQEMVNMKFQTLSYLIFESPKMETCRSLDRKLIADLVVFVKRVSNGKGSGDTLRSRHCIGPLHNLVTFSMMCDKVSALELEKATQR